MRLLNGVSPATSSRRRQLFSGSTVLVAFLIGIGKSNGVYVLFAFHLNAHKFFAFFGLF